MRFEDIVRQIENEYRSMPELSDSWRFLYTPKQTLRRHNGLLILGKNPGGRLEQPIPSVEEGNAYLVENWGTCLQSKFVSFMMEMALRIDWPGGAKDLLDRSVTSNLVPFCSRSWKELPSKELCESFGSLMWLTLIPQLKPKVIVSIGNGPVSAWTLVAQARKDEPAVFRRAQHRNQEVHIAHYEDYALIGLPHLSNPYAFVDGEEILNECAGAMLHLKEYKMERHLHAV